MLVTLSGIVILVRPMQFWKALFPMLMTGLPSIVAGITSLPDAPSSHPVMVTAPSLISYFKLELRGSSSTGLTSSLTSCCFSSTGLVSATGSTATFSPHPPRNRGSDMASKRKGTGFMGYGFSLINFTGLPPKVSPQPFASDLR